ncbi:MAG: hypothetical protein R2820_05425 [Cyclobacteriaceae bacterium]|nr:hypothetical protein [Cyclobacteriaceae bacterium]
MKNKQGPMVEEYPVLYALTLRRYFPPADGQALRSVSQRLERIHIRKG